MYNFFTRLDVLPWLWRDDSSAEFAIVAYRLLSIGYDAPFKFIYVILSPGRAFSIAKRRKILAINPIVFSL